MKSSIVRNITCIELREEKIQNSQSRLETSTFSNSTIYSNSLPAGYEVTGEAPGLQRSVDHEQAQSASYQVTGRSPGPPILHYGKFLISKLFKTQGLTVANTLRRILLYHVPTTSINSIKFFACNQLFNSSDLRRYESISNYQIEASVGEIGLLRSNGNPKPLDPNVAVGSFRTAKQNQPPDRLFGTGLPAPAARNQPNQQVTNQERAGTRGHTVHYTSAPSESASIHEYSRIPGMLESVLEFQSNIESIVLKNIEHTEEPLLIRTTTPRCETSQRSCLQTNQEDGLLVGSETDWRSQTVPFQTMKEPGKQGVQKTRIPNPSRVRIESIYQRSGMKELKSYTARIFLGPRQLAIDGLGWRDFKLTSGLRRRSAGLKGLAEPNRLEGPSSGSFAGQGEAPVRRFASSEGNERSNSQSLRQTVEDFGSCAPDRYVVTNQERAGEPLAVASHRVAPTAAGAGTHSTEKIKKTFILRAKDLKLPKNIQVVYPEQYIATFILNDENRKFDQFFCECTIETTQSFSSVGSCEANKHSFDSNRIQIQNNQAYKPSAISPIKKVNYTIESIPFKYEFIQPTDNKGSAFAGRLGGAEVERLFGTERIGEATPSPNQPPIGQNPNLVSQLEWQSQTKQAVSSQTTDLQERDAKQSPGEAGTRPTTRSFDHKELLTHSSEEQIVFEIWTNGSISPQKALEYAMIESTKLFQNFLLAE